MSDTLGIWPVRLEARGLAERLAQQLGGELFRPWEQAESQKVQFQAVFEQRSQWVLIMAAGIATRFIDGLMRDKRHDPAVVVLDEAGRYAIALLGGHEGGANALAYRVANAVGAIPVVTTATEAIKPLVVGIGCRKGVAEEQITRAILHALALLTQRQGQDAAIAPTGCGPVSAFVKRLEARPQAQSQRQAQAAGDSGVGNSAAGVRETWDTRELAHVRELVTVDLKANEPALVSFSRRYGIPLRVIARHQIEGRSWVTRPSEWVRQSVGLDGVCEPCALIACGRGRLVVPKTTLDGVAVAVVEDHLEFVS